MSINVVDVAEASEPIGFVSVSSRWGDRTRPFLGTILRGLESLPMVVLFHPTLLSGLLDLSFTVLLGIGAVLFVIGAVAFAMFAYKSIKSDGMKDPREVAPQATEENELREGDPDEEWDYY